MGFISSFFDMLGEMFSSGGWGIFMGILVIILVLVLVAIVLGFIGLIVWGAFHALDSWFLPEQQSTGFITGKYYEPAHFIPMTIMAGKVPVVTQQYIPDSWSVSVRMGARTGGMECRKSYYDKARPGYLVHVHYVDGRLSGKLYIRALS